MRVIFSSRLREGVGGEWEDPETGVLPWWPGRVSNGVAVCDVFHGARALTKYLCGGKSLQCGDVNTGPTTQAVSSIAVFGYTLEAPRGNILRVSQQK
ncbi:hypothetical protein E2C01_000688 [Portunus trituberculatus]|uniref:Uncharacterized protein n=1 Tax=Portunus trituberculatus TaxID=210409 RepID=A0A5B7CKE2_PORTR|nr:hypothetical protein [Portunus trituberculatus]